LEVARRAVGVDLSPGMLVLARGRGLEVLEGNACELPFEDGSFDLTYCGKILASVPDLPKALAEMARVTRPGGRVVAELYSARSVRGLVLRLKPATRIGRGRGVTDKEVYTRYARLDEVTAALPPSLALERADGIRVLSPVAAPFSLPVRGPWWARLETALAGETLRKYSGFLVITARPLP
jgi:SAM-dependent methyltransferase